MTELTGKYYVYTLTDPRDGNVFYVGKGCGKRAWQHMKNAITGKDENSRKILRIREITRSGLEPQVSFIHDGLSNREALRLERWEIGTIGLANLTNISPGIISAEDREIEHAKYLLATMKPFHQWAMDPLTNWTAAMIRIWGSHRAFYDWYVAQLLKLASGDYSQRIFE